MTMSEILKDKTIVLTGAGQGLGEATAFVLAEAGAQLMLLDVNQDTLKAVAGQLASAGPRSRPGSATSAARRTSRPPPPRRGIATDAATGWSTTRAWSASRRSRTFRSRSGTG